MGAGLITTLLIAALFSPVLQGYYYTFNSVLAFQVFAELGLGTVLTSFASHEWAKLAFDQNGRITGDQDALSRLTSLGSFALRWYMAAGVAMTLIFAIGGLYFFGASGDQVPSWRAPWIGLSVVTGLNLCVLPVWALLEGCNQVSAVNYFRMTDFQRMFGTLLESGCVFGGQYLYIVADLSSLRRPIYDQTCALDFPGDFLDGIERLCSIAGSRERNAIWGAASKGVVFAVYLQRAGARLEFAIDINPAKQNKYLASSGLLVLPPEQALRLLQPGDNVFVMNSNYLDEIVAQSGNQYHYCKVDHE